MSPHAHVFFSWLGTQTLRRLRVVVLTVLAAWAVVAPAWGQDADALSSPITGVAPSAPVTGSEAPEATLSLNQRKIVTFRASLLGDTPADRGRLARFALDAALQTNGKGELTRTSLGDSVRFELDGHTLFFFVAGDIARPRPASLLEAASLDVLERLQIAVAEYREANDPRHFLKGGAYSLAATVLMAVLVRLLFLGRRRLVAHLEKSLQLRTVSPLPASVSWVTAFVEHAGAAARVMTGAISWAVALLLMDAWVTYVLHQFAYTRPWGERSTEWLLQVLQQFALSMASAVPGLVVAALIFAMARVVSRATAAFLQRVERGETQLSWLDTDTAVPTRRLAAVGIWLFALAMAYPYLPGANSEAFKGVTVLAGLMLSLGASSVVGQALSGLSLMYSRSLRVGEYVKIGEVEGTVVSLGMFTTKVHTGMGEEVSLPNTVLFSQPIRNFSRLVQDGHFMLHTAVTIGYATPWRQVHALLLEAARRTPGVAGDPAPYVVQTALSDFYIEYRLCAQSNKNAPRRRVEALNQLHANVLDVFNEQGVQIMSPHYMADPPEPQVVPPGPWSPARDVTRQAHPGDPPVS